MFKRKSRKRNVIKETKRRVRSSGAKKNIWKERFVLGFKCFIILAIALPMLFGVYTFLKFIGSSDTFCTKEIIISGTKRIPIEQIRKTIGIKQKEKIYKLDIVAIKEAIKKNALVKDVVVRRQLPDRLIINLTERAPFAIIKESDNKYYEMDIDAVVISKLDSLEGATIPIIEGVKEPKQTFTPGQQLDSTRVNKAISILKTVFVSDIVKYFNIVRINVGNIRQVVLFTDKNIEIQLGNDDIEKKLNKLVILLNERRQDIKDSSYIDLRFGGVIIRPGRS